jgi:acetyl esterase/lipase
VRRVVLALALLALALAWPPPAVAQTVDVRHDVEYGTANGKRLLLDVYVPRGEGLRPAIVMIHGGGWRVGDKASWEPEAQRLAARGWVAFSVNYRLDEPAVFPAEVDDVQTAVRWVRANASEYAVDPARIAALGDSAGGHLTAMLATLGQGSRDEGARIRVGAAWSPPVDLTALAGSRGDGWARPLLGCTRDTCPDTLAGASPVNHVDSSDAPLYLVNSTEELVPLSQAQAMAERLKAAGVDHKLDVFPGTRHALDFRDDAWAPTVAFLEAHIERDDDGGGLSPVVPVAAVALVVGLVAVVLLRRRPASGARPV